MRSEIEKMVGDLVEAIDSNDNEGAKSLVAILVTGVLTDINRIANALEKMAEAGLTPG